ncbi:hypothetical protein JMUB6875_57250 [Nocardia sp. JMUB6875]|uniref:hypothetical protein n=1 Tax=Nocardia sp. JMUB6875 TaxID=3158170 RepID=UPI0032E65923
MPLPRVFLIPPPPPPRSFSERHPVRFALGATATLALIIGGVIVFTDPVVDRPSHYPPAPPFVISKPIGSHWLTPAPTPTR